VRPWNKNWCRTHYLHLRGTLLNGVPLSTTAWSTRRAGNRPCTCVFSLSLLYFVVRHWRDAQQTSRRTESTNWWRHCHGNRAPAAAGEAQSSRSWIHHLYSLTTRHLSFLVIRACGVYPTRTHYALTQPRNLLMSNPLQCRTSPSHVKLCQVG